jgi:hypothetical protein
MIQAWKTAESEEAQAAALTKINSDPTAKGLWDELQQLDTALETARARIK